MQRVYVEVDDGRPMPPAPEIVANLQALSTLGWVTALALAGLVLHLGSRIDRGCSECTHCKRIEDEKAVREEAARVDFEHRLGWHARNREGASRPARPQGAPRCPDCDAEDFGPN